VKLSVLIPVYNERNTIAQVVATVASALPGVTKEIVIVDDCSNDGTDEFLRARLGNLTGIYSGVQTDDADTLEPIVASLDNRAPITFRVLFHERNRGKGGAVKTAMKAATGDVIVIQDADLEYDPADWERMYHLIAVRRIADVVYGSRFYGLPHRSLFYHHYLANLLISVLFNALYNQTISDVEVCYKMMTREVLQTLRLSCDDFGFEVEISAQIALWRNWRIYEMAISYYGRTYAEGKKINWRDGLKAIWYLFKYRFQYRDFGNRPQ
jgi:glycosyltransferase involved in cell wall biosynthesis